jgi:hypothetical protein
VWAADQVKVAGSGQHRQPGCVPLGLRLLGMRGDQVERRQGVLLAVDVDVGHPQRMSATGDAARSGRQRWLVCRQQLGHCVSTDLALGSMAQVQESAASERTPCTASGAG